MPCFPVSPRRCEVDSIDGTDEIHSARWNADLEHRVSIGEILRGHVTRRSTERFEGMEYPRRVVGGRFHPHVHVLGCARMPVEGKCVASNEEEPGVSGEQARQQFFEVGVQRDHGPSLVPTAPD